MLAFDIFGDAIPSACHGLRPDQLVLVQRQVRAFNLRRREQWLRAIDAAGAHAFIRKR